MRSGEFLDGDDNVADIILVSRARGFGARELRNERTKKGKGKED